LDRTDHQERPEQLVLQVHRDPRDPLERLVLREWLAGRVFLV